MRYWQTRGIPALDQVYNFEKGKPVTEKFEDGDVVEVKFQATVLDAHLARPEVIQVEHPYYSGGFVVPIERVTLVRRGNDPASDPVGTYRAWSDPTTPTVVQSVYVKVADDHWAAFGAHYTGRKNSEIYEDSFMHATKVISHEVALKHLRGEV